MKLRHLVVVILAVGLLLPRLARAQDTQPLTWISFSQAQRGQSQALTRAIVKYNGPLYDKLIADGHVTSWGIAQSINHWPGDGWSHIEWVTFTGWEGVNQFVQGFVANMMAKSEEQQKAEAAEFESLVVAGSHHDSVVRHLAFNPGAGGRPVYLNLAFLKARPGKEEDGMAVFNDYVAGVLQGVQDAGQIGAYGIYVPEIHGDHSWSHVVWYGMPGLGAKDAVRNGFGAAAAARSEEENAEFQSRVEAAFVPDTHHDRILVVNHYAGAGGQEGED